MIPFTIPTAMWYYLYDTFLITRAWKECLPMLLARHFQVWCLPYTGMIVCASIPDQKLRVLASLFPMHFQFYPGPPGPRVGLLWWQLKCSFMIKIGWFSMSSPLPRLHHHDIMTIVGLFFIYVPFVKIRRVLLVIAQCTAVVSSAL